MNLKARAILILTIMLFKSVASASSENLIVAVIDGGININHPDLRDHIWINQNEIPNNGIDDDYNGYIDDYFGWNFLGAREGNAYIHLNSESPLEQRSPELQLRSDTLDEVREYNSLYNLETMTESQKLRLRGLEDKIRKKLKRANSLLNSYELDKRVFKEACLTLGLEAHELNSPIDLGEKPFGDSKTLIAYDFLFNSLQMGLSYEFILEEIDTFKKQIDFHYNINLNQRKHLIKDDGTVLFEKGYGNNNVIGPNPKHGSLVSHLLMKSLENKQIVKIMPIRAIPDGSERDKDIINAIYYAVENGANIINMSFGKYFSIHKKEVWEAMRAAQRRGVLIVLAAGNDRKNIDMTPSYPNPKYGKEVLENTLTVAACNSEGQLAPFSNFGEKSIDICAPGVNIELKLFSKESVSGSSFAVPQISAAAAALINGKNLNIYELIAYLLENFEISLKN